MNETIREYSSSRDNSSSRELEKQKRTFKIIVTGDRSVGKSCLTFRFCGREFPSRTEATIGLDFLVKPVEIDGEVLKLRFWDTAGEERLRESLMPSYYRRAHAAVFVYDVTRFSTFNNLPRWIAEFEEYNQMKQNGKVAVIPKILVGNKCDRTGEKAVSTRMAQAFANTHNMALFETSALDNSEFDQVKAIVMTLADKLKNSNPMMTGTVPRNESTIILEENNEENKDNCVCNC